MTTDIRFEVLKGTGASKCRGCEEFIYWIKTRAGKNMPVNADGTPHWATCKKADSFRKKHVVNIAPHRFMPMLLDLKDFLDDIEKAGDSEGHAFVEKLLLLKEDGNLSLITEQQFDWLEKLHEKFAA